MLKGINKLISPELLKILCEMGHGDEIVIADGNFPSANLGKRVIRADGRGGAEILLTSKEFQVAELFMRSPETVISAESIMEKAWGFDSETEITVVWTYISYLRKKLKMLGSSVGIKAVRNIGYTLENENA